VNGFTLRSRQAAEIAIVVAAGVAIAAGLTWLVVGKFGISGGQSPVTNAAARGGAPAALPAPGAKPRVAVVNYPLWYFTKRIAGDHCEIVFPIPQDVDPSFWKPDARGVRQYQQADKGDFLSAMQANAARLAAAIAKAQ
jgi:ABC-type Zn uptake system ZnuABC Zn-binding protein ZnuA